MAHLNKQERDNLANDLKDKTFQQIRGYVNHKDPQARLAYFRNVQQSGKWMTRYILAGLGTQITIYESPAEQTKGGKIRRKYSIAEIVVESTAENTR